MIRTYCDNCGAEITKDNPCGGIQELFLPMKILREHVKVNISVQKAGTSHYTDSTIEHVCIQCITDALVRLDKCPKPTPPVSLADASRAQVETRLAELNPNWAWASVNTSNESAGG